MAKRKYPDMSTLSPGCVLVLRDGRKITVEDIKFRPSYCRHKIIIEYTNLWTHRDCIYYDEKGLCGMSNLAIMRIEAAPPRGFRKYAQEVLK